MLRFDLTVSFLGPETTLSVFGMLLIESTTTLEFPWAFILFTKRKIAINITRYLLFMVIVFTNNFALE
jgi:hypothetical protein